MIDGFEVPLHRSLTEPILLGGAPRTVAIANGTLAAAVGLGLHLWLPGLALWLVGHALAVLGRARRSAVRAGARPASQASRAAGCLSRMLNLAEYRRRPALLADWLPWAGLVAPGVVLNKDGSFQRTARFRGPDLDSATESELVATDRTPQQRAAPLRHRLGALRRGRTRRRVARYPRSTFPEGLSWLVDEERRAAYEAAGSHFESSYRLTLLWLPPAEAQGARRARDAGNTGARAASTGASIWRPSSARPNASAACSKAS